VHPTTIAVATEIVIGLTIIQQYDVFPAAGSSHALSPRAEQVFFVVRERLIILLNLFRYGGIRGGSASPPLYSALSTLYFVLFFNIFISTGDREVPAAPWEPYYQAMFQINALVMERWTDSRT